MRQIRRNLTVVGVILVVMAACSGAVSPSATPAAATASPSAVTTAPAASPSPARSTVPSASPSPSRTPAAGQIVFFDGDRRQVYIERADGSDVRLLVASDFDDVKPRLSPDGRTVAFTRYAPLSSNIFVVNVDGTGLREVDKASCVKTCGGDEEVSWSPDGTRFVVTRGLFAKAVSASSTPFNVGLWLMDADGTGARQITLKGRVCNNVCPGGAQDNRAAWSPDGKRLVFTRDTYTSPEQFGIFTIAIDGSDLRPVTPTAMNADDPAWSPDGDLIAFQSPPEPSDGVEQDIYTIHPNGTGLTKLTSALGPGWSNGASWSPDGRQIVFSHLPSTDGASDLYVMNHDGSDLHLLAPTHLWENSPYWGPDPAQ